MMFDFLAKYGDPFLLGIMLYYVPLGLCLLGYTIRTFKDYASDAKDRDEYIHKVRELRNKYPGEKDRVWVMPYRPTLTVGTIVGRFLASVTPAFNILAAIFDVSLPLLRGICELFNDVLKQPLVPKLEDFQA